MKKIYILVCTLWILLGCQYQDDTIRVYVRDQASGTRQALEEHIAINEVNRNVLESNSNQDMITKVN